LFSHSPSFLIPPVILLFHVPVCRFPLFLVPLLWTSLSPLPPTFLFSLPFFRNGISPPAHLPSAGLLFHFVLSSFAGPFFCVFPRTGREWKVVGFFSRPPVNTYGQRFPRPLSVPPFRASSVDFLNFFPLIPSPRSQRYMASWSLAPYFLSSATSSSLFDHCVFLDVFVLPKIWVFLETSVRSPLSRPVVQMPFS